MAGRPSRPAMMLASGDLEWSLAYSEGFSIRTSIPIITDSLDAVFGVMNKSVDGFAGCSQASSRHHGFTVSVIPAPWVGIIVLDEEVLVPFLWGLSQGQWGQTQTQYEDQQQGAQAHHHLFQQRLLPRAKGGWQGKLG